MKKTRSSEEQMVKILREADMAPVSEVAKIYTAGDMGNTLAVDGFGAASGWPSADAPGCAHDYGCRVFTSRKSRLPLRVRRTQSDRPRCLPPPRWAL